MVISTTGAIPMSPEDILKNPAISLSQSQRERYFEDGFLLIEDFLGEETLGKLRDSASRLESLASPFDECPEDFEFEMLPETGQRQLRQVLCAGDYVDDLWNYTTTASLLDMVTDLIGPNIKSMFCAVSFKLPGGRGFPWHQDVAFLPCSNLSPVNTFTFLEDVDSSMGPTKMIPGSHHHAPYDHYDEQGRWLGRIGEHDLVRVPEEEAVEICGPAGSVLLFNLAIVHKAERSHAKRARPMIQNGYMSADAYCYVTSLYHSRHNWELIRGTRPLYVDSDGPRWKLPPTWEHHDGVRIDNLNHNL